jgi:cytosine/adenosine deaminase-related metal-dependent hydrolase
LTPALRKTYRTTDRRIPWIVRAAEGSDPALRRELDALAAANVLRQNTVIAHGTALEPDDAPRLVAAAASLAWCPESDLRLYGRTGPALALRAAGVRVGLGSDGAPSGARDLLSSLAVAGARSGLPAADLLALATRDAAAVARLPVGGAEPLAAADFLVADDVDALLAGDRRAIALLVVRGRAIFGDPALLEEAVGKIVTLTLDGAEKALEARVGARLRALVRRHAVLGDTRWLAGVRL